MKFALPDGESFVWLLSGIMESWIDSFISWKNADLIAVAHVCSVFSF